MTVAKYQFEIEDNRFIAGGDKDTEREAKIFASRIGFDIEDSNICHLPDKRLLLEYVAAVHRNILWYVRNHKKQTYWYRAYMVITAILVIVIPGVAVIVPWVALKETASSVVVSAQLTALFTGVFGLHRLLSAWLFRRNSAHTFWKAGSDLKALLYTLEERWRKNAVIGDSLDPLFVEDLTEGKKAAREIVKNEREGFFQSFSQTSVDLQDVVSKGITNAEKVVSKIAGPIVQKIATQEQKKSQASADLRKAREEVVSLIAKKRFIEELIKRSKYRHEKETDTPRKEELLSRIKNADSRLVVVKFDLADKKASYEAKRAVYHQKNPFTL